MRTFTNGTVTVTSPDAIVFLKDNNILTVTDSTYNVTVAVTVGVTVLQYLGTTTSLTFNLSNAFRLNPSITSFTVSVVSNGTTKNFTIPMSQILDGKTLPTRRHASEETILVPQGTTSVQLYTPAACNIVSSGGLTDTLSVGRNTKAVGTWGSILYQYSGASFKYGDFDEEKSIDANNTMRSVLVKQCCIPEHGIIVQYVNTDGCTRYLIGSLNREATSLDTFDYYRSNTIIKDRPRQMVVGNTMVLTVFVAGVPRNAFAKDIMYCDNITLRNSQNTPLSATLVTAEFTDVADNEYQDISLEFNVLI